MARRARQLSERRPLGLADVFWWTVAVLFAMVGGFIVSEGVGERQMRGTGVQGGVSLGVAGWITTFILLIAGRWVVVRFRRLDWREAASRGVCWRCGYGVRGLPASVHACPECGASIVRRARG